MFLLILLFALPLTGMEAKRSYFIKLCKQLIKGQLLVEEISPEQFSWTDVDGKTLLHYATFHDINGSLIETLCKLHPELLEKTDKAHYTPLHTAAFHGNPIAVETLLAQGANHSALNQVGKTPAHLVMNLNYFPAIKIILGYLAHAGACLNAQDVYGNTPLHYLAYQGNEELYKHVTNHLQLMTQLKNNNNYTPEHILYTSQCPRLVEDYIKLINRLRQLELAQLQGYKSKKT